MRRITTPFDPHIKRLIDLIGIKLNGDCGQKNTIIISGAPRTGTTWLMEILATLPKYKTIFEPLHMDRFPQLLKLNFPPRIYVPPEEDNVFLQNHLKDVFRGVKISRNPHYSVVNLKEINRRLPFNGVIVKFINGNRLLPWISKRFETRATYLIIRHPCATIASQLKTGWIGYPKR